MEGRDAHRRRSIAGRLSSLAFVGGDLSADQLTRADREEAGERAEQHELGDEQTMRGDVPVRLLGGVHGCEASFVRLAGTRKEDNDGGERERARGAGSLALALNVSVGSGALATGSSGCDLDCERLLVDNASGRGE